MNPPKEKASSDPMYLVTVNQKALRDEAGHVRTFETNDQARQCIESEILPAWKDADAPPRLTIEHADRWEDPPEPEPPAPPPAPEAS